MLNQSVFDCIQNVSLQNVHCVEKYLIFNSHTTIKAMTGQKNIVISPNSSSLDIQRNVRRYKWVVTSLSKTMCWENAHGKDSIGIGSLQFVRTLHHFTKTTLGLITTNLLLVASKKKQAWRTVMKINVIRTQNISPHTHHQATNISPVHCSCFMSFHIWRLRAKNNWNWINYEQRDKKYWKAESLAAERVCKAIYCRLKERESLIPLDSQKRGPWKYKFAYI